MRLSIWVSSSWQCLVNVMKNGEKSASRLICVCVANGSPYFHFHEPHTEYGIRNCALVRGRRTERWEEGKDVTRSPSMRARNSPPIPLTRITQCLPWLRSASIVEQRWFSPLCLPHLKISQFLTSSFFFKNCSDFSGLFKTQCAHLFRLNNYVRSGRKN